MRNGLGQKQRLLARLKRSKWVSVPDMMRMGIAKYTNRISDLRKDGYTIINYKIYDSKRGIMLSRYSLEG